MVAAVCNVLDACNATSASCCSTEEYEKMDILGDGSFGVVQQGRHRGTGNTVAIKFLRSADATKLLEETGFLDACGGNPYVVASHGLVCDPATTNLCLAMEYVGPDLHAFLSERPPLQEAVVRGHMRQLLTGAKNMHECGIVHRDIKPPNILVGDGGKILKFCDFGFPMSRATHQTMYGDADMFQYRAPEMLLAKPNYDARVDTWSLGCIMDEMLTGNTLFPGPGDDEETSQLWCIFRRLGFPVERMWPEFPSLPLARMVPRAQQHKLREMFHQGMLSDDGFQLLKGLLERNPDKRLTAATALQLPWFTLHALRSTHYLPIEERPRSL